MMSFNTSTFQQNTLKLAQTHQDILPDGEISGLWFPVEFRVNSNGLADEVSA